MMTNAFPLGIRVARPRRNSAQVLWSFILSACLLPRVVADVVLDGSLGSADTLSGPNFEITADLGKQVDGNLFHSFQSFNINSSQSATFSGPDSVANILSRVTGGQPSNIDGLLRSTIPGADFYFLNPAGVLFGPNASLDVQGSFHVSTADFIRMEDGVVFNASPNAQDAVLSTAPPAAFGFLDEDPADISIQESVIEVPQSEALSIVGGDIDIREGSLSAPSGQINLVSTDSVGETPFDGTDLNVGEFEKRGAITIADNALIDTRGDSGGRIFIRGGQFSADNSEINATTLGAGEGRGIDIAVTDQLNLIDTVVRSSSRSQGNAGNLDIQSGEFNLQDSSVFGSTFAAGQAGDVTITTTGSINLSGESFITSNTLDSDDAGNSAAAGRVSISASLLDLEGSYIESVSGSDSSGDAGEIQIDVDNLALRDSAQIDSSTFSSGQGGIIDITASEDIRITGRPNEDPQTGFFSVTNKSGAGGNLTVSAGGSIVMDGGRILTRTLGDANAGTLTVNANDLALTNGAQIFAGIGNRDIGNPEGLGKGGDVFITAIETLSISGTDPETGSSSGIFSTAQVGKGDSGNLTVEAPDLRVRDGGAISISTSSGGNSGELIIEAKVVEVNDGAAIRANTSGDGNGGKVTINALEALRLNNGFIGSNTFDTGDAGQVVIDAGEVEFLNEGRIFNGTDEAGDGGDVFVTADVLTADATPIDHEPRFHTGIAASANIGSNGRGGKVIVNVRDISLLDGGQISSDTDGAGNAGEVSIRNGERLIVRDGLINTSTSSGANAGPLSVNVSQIEVLDGGTISASTEGTGIGGNATINATNIRLADGGRIAATSTGTDQEIQNDRNVGRSGNISITASDSLTIQSGGTVTVETEAANAGNIKLQVERLLLLRDQGAITTSAAVEEGIGGQGNGGNITIDPDFVVLDNGSTIQANALEGMAGVVDITADFFFRSPDSIVEASAGPAGIDGTVNINSPVVNIAESVAVLPESFFDASQQLSERCSARVSESTSSFVAVGRGGLPIGPEDLAPTIALDGTSTAQGKNTESSSALVQSVHERDQFGQPDNLIGPHFATAGFGCRK